MSDAREQPTPGAGGAGDVAEMRELLGNIDRMHTRAECHLIAIHAAFWPDEPRRWVPGEATAEGMKILNEVAKLIAERDALRAAVEKIKVGTWCPNYADQGHEYPDLMRDVWRQAQEPLRDIARAALARGPAAGGKLETAGQDI
jgi:hypothetical protein